MFKKILFVLILTVCCGVINAQTGNLINGDGIQPLAADPDPYDGVITLLAPGALITSGDYNTLIGDGAGSSLTTADQSVFIGTAAGALIDNDSDNTIIGAFAADQATLSPIDNVIIGTRAARTLTSGDNVVIGTEAGMVMTSANDNVIIGEEAGEKLTEGDDNVIIGQDAGFSLTTASDNCFVGPDAGRSTTTAGSLTFVGGSSNYSIDIALETINSEYGITVLSGGAGYDNTSGLGNTFIGSSAGTDNGEGNVNTFVGYGAGAANEYGDGNTFIGYGAGFDNNRTNSTTNANRNTYLGMRTGGTNREGSDNVGLGYYADFNGNNRSRSTFIGSYAKPYNNDVTMLGYNTRVGGRYGMALGLNTRVDNQYAIAIGTNVTVAQNNTMALGGDQVANRLSVGIGTVAANRNASLDLADVDKGLLINRVTTAERTTMITLPASGVALTTTDIGLMVYDTDVKGLFSWDGAAWSAVDTNTDAQDLTLAANILSLSNDATTVDLSGYLDNTDAQDLSLTTNTLSLTNDGTSVDLSGYLDNTDTQNLTAATLTGTIVEIEIQNGTSVSVDLAPLISSLENRLTILEACSCTPLTINNPDDVIMRAILQQNIPNPFNGTSVIGYYIPQSANNAEIVFSNNVGQIVDRIRITQKGEGEVEINASRYASGMYYYTLYLDGKKIATKKMIVD